MEPNDTNENATNNPTNNTNGSKRKLKLRSSLTKSTDIQDTSLHPDTKTDTAHEKEQKPIHIFSKGSDINLHESISVNETGKESGKITSGNKEAKKMESTNTSFESEVDGEDEEETATSLLKSLQDFSKNKGKHSSRNSKTEGLTESTINFDAEEEEKDGPLLENIENTLQFFSNQAQQANNADANFNKIHEEYEKLNKLFVQSRINERKLIKKCKELTTELGSNATKVQAALKLSQNDRSSITLLKKEVAKAWKLVEANSEKEARSKEAIANMKLEIESLKNGKLNEVLPTHELAAPSTIIPQRPTSSGFNKGKMNEYVEEQEQNVTRLTSTQVKLQAQIESQANEYRILKADYADLESRLFLTTTEKGDLVNEILNLKDILATKKSEMDRDNRNRDKLEVSLKQAMEQLAKKDIEMGNKFNELRNTKDLLMKSENLLKDEKIRYEKCEKENDNVMSRIARVQQEYDEQVITITKLLSENQQQGMDLKNFEEDILRYKDELKNVTRVRDALTKKLKSAEEIKVEVETERDVLRAQTQTNIHDLDLVKKELDAAHNEIEILKRERDIAQKNFVKATGSTQKQMSVVKLAEQTKRNLEQEIQGYKEEAGKMRKLIYSLEKDRDRHITDASKYEQLVIGKDEELKMKELLIFDSKKKIIEVEKKLKEQQTLYENVRADRNVYSKNLIEAQDEINEIKRKLRIMGHQITQLKEEITNKEGALVKEHFEHSKLEKEKEALSVQIGKLQQQYEESQKMIQNQQAEENKLRHIIQEADAERIHQKKEYDGVVQERDILGTQLIRRNDELSLLYEKIKIQTSTLNKGEIQYRERLEDIRVLKLEIKKLRREKVILQTETQNVESLRNEIFKLQRDILRERTRVKVLEEELESPMNIHRWRKLSGSDPSTYELITKIQTLQKRLITKTEEVVEKELIIAQKEKLYKEVKDMLSRQPGPEMAEELRVVKEAVKIKMRECKSLASELNMYHSQVNEYKYEIERLNRDLQDIKKKYYEQKKRIREDLKKIRLNDPNYRAASIKANMMDGPKFIGGGFNVSNGATTQNGMLSEAAEGLPGLPNDLTKPEPGAEIVV